MNERRHRIPVDTATAPHEPAVRAPTTISMWLLVLSGPFLWIVHFFAVYLVAEAECAADRVDSMAFVGRDRAAVVIVVATVVALLLAVVGALACRMRVTRNATVDLYRVGEWLGWLSVLAILLVGAPIVALPVCA